MLIVRKQLLGMVNDGSDGRNDANGGSERSETENGGSSVQRRTFLKASGAGVVGSALAGCVSFNGGGESGDGGDGGGDEGDGNGSGNDSGGSSGNDLPDTISVGVLAPEPSDNPIGASIANGAQLAVDELNENGGIGGADVEISIKDTKEDPATGRSRYQELTGNEGVDMTTGVFTSEVLLNIMDDIAQRQTLHMTTGAATPEASARVAESYDEYKYHFRTGPINATHLGQNMVDFVEAKSGDLGWESVAVLVEDYAWTEPVSAVLDEKLADTGVDVAMSQRYASGTENFGPIYDEVENSGADAAFIAMAHTGTPALVQWASQQRPFEFGGIHVPMQLPSYYEATDGAANYGVTQNSATPQSEVTDETVPFAENFNEEFGNYPVYTGYISYDAVHQYASVVEEVGSVNADDVVSGLEESSYTGTAGTIEYYGEDEQFAHDVVYEEGKVWPIFMQWQDGNQEVIYPDDLATADYQTPSWL
jgi:branched-chain amino acid transport system substrate-binding protein